MTTMRSLPLPRRVRGHTRRLTTAWLAAALMASALLAACSQPAEPAEPSTWPTREWRRSSPEAQGVDSAQLRQMLEHISALELHMHELLIVRNAHVILDARFFPYEATQPHDIASITKSLTSTAVGIALARGDLTDLDARVVSFFPEHSPANDSADKQAITLEHALTMTAGFACVGEPVEQTLLEMQSTSDWVGFVLDLPMASAPGVEWTYCSPVTHLLSAVVSKAAGQPVDALLRDALFDPIGVHTLAWPRDDGAHSNGWGDARLDAEDLARIGLLFAERGQWDGRQLLDPAWIDRATSNRVGELGPDGGYGLGWWPAGAGTYYARGAGGQFLFVAPALDLVVVTFGSASPDEVAGFAAVLSEDLLPAIGTSGPLPANPTAATALAQTVDALARAPLPEPVATIPDGWMATSGRSFSIAPNPLGWTAVTLTFDGATAALSIGIGDATSTLTVGLDAVPRTSHGLDLAAPARYRGVDVALRGDWNGEVLEIGFDTLHAIHAGTMSFSLTGDSVQIEVFERTFLGSGIALTGSARP